MRYTPLYEIFSGKEYEIAEKIQRRRLQILVHSYLYYEKNINLISDHTFDKLMVELVKLQSDYPDIAKRVQYAEAFSNWFGNTGAFLPYNDQRIVGIASCLLRRKQDEIKMPEKAKVFSKSPARKKLF